MGESKNLTNSELLGLVYELKSSLISIAAQADVLGSQIKSEELEFIKQESLYLLSTISEITELERLNTKSDIASVSDVKTLLKSVKNELSPLLKQHKIAMKQELPRKLPLVIANPKTIEIAISCLVKNALNNSPEGSTVFIKSQAKQNNLQLLFCDSGNQTTKIDNERLLGQFGKTEVVLPQRPVSSGLFVYIADKAATIAGGNLSFSNIKGGVGYVLSLPTTEQLRLF